MKMNRKMCLFLAMTAAAVVIYMALFVMNVHTSFRVSTLSLLTLGKPSLTGGQARETTTGKASNESVLAGQQKKVDANNNNITNINNTSSVGETSLTAQGVKKASLDTIVSAALSAAVSSSGNESTTPTPPPGRKRYLIYVCLRGRICGGWSDRQRGLVSSYLMALAVGRNFGVIMNNPCNVKAFYVPNEVPWIIPEAELKGRSSGFLNDMGSGGNVGAILTKEAFDKRFPQDVVYISSNNGHVHKVLAKLKWKVNVPDWVRKGDGYVWAKAWKALMKPSPHLQKMLDEFLEGIGYQQRTKPLVCCHVRIGKSVTFFDGKVRLDASTVPVLWDFLDRYVNNGSRLFIATDNLGVRNAARKRFPPGSVVDTGGPIMHVDKWKKQHKVDKACVGQAYALLDQLILTKCDILVLSNSGYGGRASSLGGGRMGLFRFNGKSVQPA